MNNADKIRQMSDEELADLLEYACHYCTEGDKPLTACHGQCAAGHIAWLKQEVKT